jgi:hypothetical protein
MLNQKQIASTKLPVVGQVWISQDTRNYYRINGFTDDGLIQVQRTCYEFEGRVYRGRDGDTYYWPISTFKLPNLRVVATNSTRFESWLNRVTK